MRGSLFVDGFLRGTWRFDSKADPALLRVGLNEALPPPELNELEAEADAMLAFTTGGARPHRFEIVHLD